MENLRTAFLDPGPEYTLTPFWFLNGELKKETIAQKLKDFKAKGVDGVVIHPRIGLPDDLEYMGGKYMDFVAFIVREAAGLDMRVVLYDEGMYPSGSANGQVVAGSPAFAARGLRMTEHTVHDPTVLSERLAEYEKCELAAAVKKDREGNLLPETAVPLPCRDGTVGFYPPDAGEWDVILLISTYSHGTIRGIHFGEDDGEANAPKAADILNPMAVRRFLELTHEKYYAALQKYFGNTIEAVFTDEPDVLGRGVDKSKIKPWTVGFMDWYKQCGNAPLDLLSLFFHVGPDTEKKRRAFEKAVNKRLLEVYYGQLSAWCEAHGVSLTGHPHEPDDIGLLQVFQIPGQDVVWRWVAPENGLGLSGRESTLAKCASDAARHCGAHRNANECFGCCGPEKRQWEFSADDMKWYMDWLFVRGTNKLFPHAFLYSTEGEKRLNERPPDVGPNNSWWPCYNLFAFYAKRMSWLMTDSVNTARVAVLCEEDRLPFTVTRPLYQSQIEFNYLEEKLLVSGCTVENGRIKIQKQCYDTVLVENPAILYPALTEKLQNFLKGGGRVLLYQPGANTLALEGAMVLTDLAQLSALTESLREVVLIPACSDLRMSHVRKGGKDFYLFTNEGEEGYEGTLSIRQTGRFERWDALRGTMEKVHGTEQDGGGSVFTFSLARRESAIFFADSSQKPFEQEEEPLCKAATFDISEGWRIEKPGGEKELLRRLVSWTEIPGMQHFSGTVPYEKTLRPADFAGPGTVRKIALDCGTVGEMARLTVNGTVAGVKMWAPYRFSMEPPFEKGIDIRLEITNSVANRISGAQVPSGLMGPVRIEIYR